MAAKAGLSQPFVESTSTHACIRRTAVISISFVSADNGSRYKCACTRTLAFTCGSFYFDFGSTFKNLKRN